MFVRAELGYYGTGIIYDGGEGPSPEEGIKGKSAKVWVGPLTTETESGVVFHPS